MLMLAWMGNHCIMLHGGYFEYWKARLVVVGKIVGIEKVNKRMKQDGSKKDQSRHYGILQDVEQYNINEY
uniref:Uncharacterized protein n=1 Tax=Tanacetum cinerariifolium TaxID=118510 RepID=A0A6L2J540_TANCI|nr:hypothetical protein [Tanacetum cinerariifolium]